MKGGVRSKARQDRLRAINDELRGRDPDPSSPWLPLESNPELVTAFARNIGLPPSWRFEDVYGLDAELLAMVPEADSCAAVILLFPCTQNIYEARAREEQETRAAAQAEGQHGGGFAARSAFFLKQHAEFGNACGTIASVHALANAREAFMADAPAGAPASSLVEFCNENQTAGADARGRALLASPALKLASDVAAAAPAAQTELPDRNGPDLDHHFTAFVRTAGRLLELDGTKWAPVDCGPCAPSDSLLLAAAAAVRERFTRVEPDSIEFSLMALVRAGGQ
jgi:ubiquitin carboxyl-terminal hydrolase L3